MAERRVEVRFSAPGFDEVMRDFEKLSLVIDKLSVKLDKLSLKMDKLSKKRITPDVDAKGLDRANASLDKLNARLDKINHKRVTAKVNVDVNNGRVKRDLSKLTGDSGGSGFFSRLFSGGSGGDSGGGGGGGGGGFAGGLAGLQGAGIGGLVALAAALVPSLVPYGLGLGVGGGGLYGAYKLDPTAFDAVIDQAKNQYMRSLTQRNNSIFGGQPQLLPGVGEHQPGGTQTFLHGIINILGQIGQFINQIGPSLADMFKSSLPIVRSFVFIMEQFAKAVLPAITQSLQQLRSTGALKIITQGFVILAKGVASFITALGPGMKDSAIIFKTTMILVALALRLAGNAANWFAHLIINIVEGARIFQHDVAHYFDVFRHETANVFDGVRHEVAHIWDSMFNDTLGSAIRNIDRIMVDVSNWGHRMATDFDNMRHSIAAIWDQFWSEFGRMTSNGIHNVLAFFDRLPGQIGHALSSLGHSLMNIGTTAMHDFLSGLEHVGTSILGWVKNFFTGIPHAIMSFLHMSPPHPGSVFYDLGANFMHHVQAGMQSRAASVAGAAHGIAGGSAAAYAHSLANRIGWGGQWGFINDVAMRESGWSMTARNPSSGAYGIAQFINGPSEYYQYGGNPNTVAGQVIAFFNYIRQRYGSPAGAWAHELNYGWYDQGGKLPPGLSLALNTTGHDEIHTTGGGWGGDTYNIFVLDESYSDAQALRLIQKVQRYKKHHGNRTLGIA